MFFDDFEENTPLHVLMLNTDSPYLFCNLFLTLCLYRKFYCDEKLRLKYLVIRNSGYDNSYDFKFDDSYDSFNLNDSNSSIKYDLSKFIV